MLTDSATSALPIYDQLIEEQGDVLADVREAADEIRQQVERSLDFSRAVAEADAA